MILITGCTGYIGSRLTFELLKAHKKVRGLVPPEEEDKAKILLNKGMEVWSGDLLKPETLSGIGSGIDMVYHLAGLHSASIEKMEGVYVHGTKALLEEFDPKLLKVFIAAGNGAVYGSCGNDILTEDHPLCPSHPFGVISLDAEQLVMQRCLESQFPGIVLRIAEVYGPGEYNPVKNSNSGSISLLGDGLNYSSKIHIDDLIQILKLAPLRLKPGKSYNVCDDTSITQKDYYSEISEITGGPEPRWMPADTVPERIKLGIHGLRMLSIRMSNQTIKKALGYTFDFPTCREGLKSLYNSEKHR